MKANIVKWPAGLCIGLLLGGVAAVGPGCAHPGAVVHTSPPPPYVTYYDYDYYPDLNVYYYPAGDTYYWYDEGRWRSDRHLPPRYAIGQAHYQRLHLRTQPSWGAAQKPFQGSGKPADEYGPQP